MVQDFQAVDHATITRLASRIGFELAGVAPADELSDFIRYSNWVNRGNAGAMKYLSDHRAGLRIAPETLLPGAKSVICVAKLYNGPEPYSTTLNDQERGWISRYAWGEDYHRVLRDGLGRLAAGLEEHVGPFGWKACVDTAPLLERSLAREAGLGWIGKNTCLINQEKGSWFFLGELITTLPLTANLEPQPDRCGTCTRCIDACPTSAIVPAPEGRFEIDSRLCISYLTIELRGPMDPALRAQTGNHVFGCDICQDVCPWNRKAAISDETWRAPRTFAPPLAKLAEITEAEFREMFRPTPVERTRYRGFLRNVAIAMGNSGSPAVIESLQKLASNEDTVVADHARWALDHLKAA
jgi:epoxyqueuosine reductase